ncbi:MAG: hypothetical protein ACP5NA_00250 [Candidatus Acidulodesulfobacterium sp.]
MYKNFIYIEEYDIYQYFDGDKSVFSHSLTDDYYSDDSSETEVNYAVAVISKNINFSVIPEKNVKNRKKFYLSRYIGKSYKNGSYFLAYGINGEYGVYHALPSNIKKYYSLFQRIDIVIPYDYLVIEFLKEKFNGFNLKKNFLFIEKTDDVYKIIIISNGFSIMPVLSFKADMITDNLNILKTKIDSENKFIKIEQIIADCDCGDFKNFFGNAEILNFTAKDFFEYFERINKTFSHFENPEIKFKKIEDKKNRTKNIYIAVLIFVIFFMEAMIISYGKKTVFERQKIEEMNKKIAVLSLKIDRDKSKIIFNGHFSKVNIVNYLKSFFALLPKTVKIKKIKMMKSGTGYIFYATVFDNGGYRRFSYDYNTIAKKLDYKKTLSVKYLFGKSGKPSMKFLGFLN